MVPVHNKKQLSHIVLLALLGAGLLCIIIALLVKLIALNDVEKIPVEQLLQQYWQEQQAEASLPMSDSLHANPIDGTTNTGPMNKQGAVAHNAQGSQITDEAERSEDAKATADPSTNNSGAAVETDTAGRIDINAATAEQLQQLKGIGPSKAQAIVEDREQKGRFKRVEDIKRVKGIGEKLFAGIQESIVAGP